MRRSAVLAVLLDTRGLTELVVLTVGLQLGVLTVELYSLMVVMALVTTAIPGTGDGGLGLPGVRNRNLAVSYR